jgi:hypothetical protein
LLGDKSFWLDEAFSVAVRRRATALAYVGPGSGQYSDPVGLVAQLRDFDGDPVGGAGVSFNVGTRWAAGTTDGTGGASAVIVLDGPAGPSPVAVGFAGNSLYEPSSATAPFTVGKELATVTFTGRHLTTTTGTSASVLLSATVVEEADGNPGNGLGTAQVAFTQVGGGTLCTASVSPGSIGEGTASCTTAVLPLGSRAMVARLVAASYGGPVDVGAFAVAQVPSGSAAGGGRVADAGATDDFAFQAKPVRRAAPTGDALHVRRSGGAALVTHTTSLTSLATGCSGGKAKVCTAVVEGASAARWSVDLADGAVTVLAGGSTLRVDATDAAEPDGAGADRYAAALGAPDSYVVGSPAAQVVLTRGNVRIPT